MKVPFPNGIDRQQLLTSVTNYDMYSRGNEHKSQS